MRKTPCVHYTNNWRCVICIVDREIPRISNYIVTGGTDKKNIGGTKVRSYKQILKVFPPKLF